MDEPIAAVVVLSGAIDGSAFASDNNVRLVCRNNCVSRAEYGNDDKDSNTDDCIDEPRH